MEHGRIYAPRSYPYGRMPRLTLSKHRYKSRRWNRLCRKSAQTVPRAMGIQHRLEDHTSAQSDGRVDTRHLRSPRRAAPALMDYGTHPTNVLRTQRLWRQMDTRAPAWRRCAKCRRHSPLWCHPRSGCQIL